MLELQVPLLAAKALLLLLLFAFVYAVVRRGIGDLRSVPDEEEFSGLAGGGAMARGRSAKPGRTPEILVEESNVLPSDASYPLSSDSTEVGRSSEGEIVLKGDEYASGRHARFTRHGGLLYVEDLGSTNGTYVNGSKAVGATPLRDGDEIKIGSTVFRFVE
ncbi:FHA domain [Rubrobacter radiotolerans]|uniref:FHA domain n=1 Tax=Rubrobacter radiotolerans TaxID=42256 RepID=A0A023WZW5_RUBRA|nr:FHA domain-containing protein [Rubrobacter radiotolerans]AHY45310.1 FHA domain [Rubrobacter radiotolerans]MDX5892722.1 FHA domain-containing protein [Rubrobacter radiotolerans]SMC02353.1 FHA domain-containing protein [Rubrobacter radiotolerans DSM 5868]